MTANEKRRNSPLVAISNRLPLTKGKSEWRWSAGGLVTALRPIMQRQSGYWVGWNGGAADMPQRVDRIPIDLRPIHLSRSHIRDYYDGFSNRTIWPLFHDLVQPPRFERGWWHAYREVNERFAEELDDLKEADGGLFWVQDYHLMLLPELLRSGSRRGRISFFLHTPFPPPELFARLPWRRELIRGLLGADVVSFHTERYRKNFVRTCGRLLDDALVNASEGVIKLEDGRTVATTANPISIDTSEFASEATSKEAQGALSRLKRQFGSRRVVLGVDRLDYTKGILERLQAFELLLERRKDLRNEITLVQIAVPSRSAVSEYRSLRVQIEQAAGRINGRFTEPGGDVPVYYLHRGVSKPRLLAYYMLADVFLVTALKDGMNLVSKEFVVTQAGGGSAGALVLSEFAGASLELDEAVPCNPFDIEGLVTRIEEALDMDEDERRRRIEAMAKQVQSHDIHDWAQREIAAAGGQT